MPHRGLHGGPCGGGVARSPATMVSRVLDDFARHMGNGFDRLYGLEVTTAQDGFVAAHVDVRDDLLQPAGLVHGGVYAAMAESVASLGTAVAVMADGRMAMGLSNLTSFLRPITAGRIHAEARAQHRGRTTWVWDVQITDDAGRLCALTRMTIAVRDAPGDPAPAGS
jgi:1,4-dihydroxy-2-naphthoyl-CoA hydrolase